MSQKRLVRKHLSAHMIQVENLAKLLGYEDALQGPADQESLAKVTKNERLDTAGQLAMRAESAQKKLNELIKDEQTFQQIIESAIEQSDGKQSSLEKIIESSIPGFSKTLQHYLSAVSELSTTLFPDSAGKASGKAKKKKKRPSDMNRTI